MYISLTFVIIPVSSLLSLPARDVVFNPVVVYIGSSVAREAMRGGQVGLLELLTNNGCVLDGLSEEQVRKSRLCGLAFGHTEQLTAYLQHCGAFWLLSSSFFVLMSEGVLCLVKREHAGSDTQNKPHSSKGQNEERNKTIR